MTKQFVRSLALRGKLTQLKLLSREDLREVSNILAVPSVYRDLHGRAGFGASEESLAKRLFEHDPFRYTLGIWAITDSALVGMVELYQHRRLPHNSVSAAVLVDPRYQGRGYGTDAHITHMNFVFSEFGVNRVTGLPMETNPASIRMNLKVGAQFCGKLRNRYYTQGSYVDAWCWWLSSERFYDAVGVTSLNLVSE